MITVELVQAADDGEVLDTIKMKQRPEKGELIHDPNSDCYFAVNFVSPVDYERSWGVFSERGKCRAVGYQHNGEWVGGEGLLESLF